MCLDGNRPTRLLLARACGEIGVNATRGRALHPGPPLGEPHLGDPSEVAKPIAGAVHVDIDHDETGEPPTRLLRSGLLGAVEGGVHFPFGRVSRMLPQNSREFGWSATQLATGTARSAPTSASFKDGVSYSPSTPGRVPMPPATSAQAGPLPREVPALRRGRRRSGRGLLSLGWPGAAVGFSASSASIGAPCAARDQASGHRRVTSPAPAPSWIGIDIPSRARGCQYA